MNARILIGTLTALALLAGACGQDATQPEREASQAPKLPPVASMNVDLGFFEQDPAERALFSPGDKSTATIFHWTNAVIRVLIANAFVNAAFTPPALAFGLAFSTTPIPQPDGSWLWTYTWNGFGPRVTIDLRGRIDQTHVDWELRLTDPSARPPLDHALWFYGESGIFANEGFWVFLDPARTDADRVARIDWTVEAENEAELIIQNLSRDDEGYGDELAYAVHGTQASVIFEDASSLATMTILWNTVTGAGSIQAPDYNGGQRGCWDERLQDTVCDVLAAEAR